MSSWLLFILFFIAPPSVESPNSQQAEKITQLFNYFNIAAAGMILLVSGLVIYITFKFREKKNDKREPSQTTGSKKLEALMIGGPFLLLVFFFYKTVTIENDLLPTNAPNRNPDVIVTGHQWWWEVQYPGLKVIAANEIHLPAGRQVLMELHAADVIHDWWVPDLGNKMDMIPGVKNYLWVNINKAGTYEGACSEFCGKQHAWMRINVVAQSEGDYNKWLQANAASSAHPSDSLAIKGKALFQSYTCSNCHRIGGTEAKGMIGPDLTHVASRKYLLTGLLQTNEDNLYKWINHPQKIKQGAYMPDFILNKDSVRALAHYLEQLK